MSWLQIPVNQLKSRLLKVDLSAIKVCCDLYLAPESSPKSKTAKYSVVTEHFRLRSIFLIGLSDVTFLMSYLALFQYSLPAPEVSRQRLVEDILKGEFGHEISEHLFFCSQTRPTLMTSPLMVQAVSPSIDVSTGSVSVFLALASHFRQHTSTLVRG